MSEIISYDEMLNEQFTIIYNKGVRCGIVMGIGVGMIITVLVLQ